MYREKLERMSVGEILEINPYLLRSDDLLLLYRELIWRLRPMVYSYRADAVASKMELAESILHRKLALFEELITPKEK